MLGHLVYNRFEAERNSWLVDRYLNLADEKNIELKLVIEEDLSFEIGEKPFLLHKGLILEQPDFAILRTRNLKLAMFYESMGVRAYNSSKVHAVCNDKTLTYAFCAENGIPTLPTRELDDVENSAFYPFVFKPIDGKGGLNVFKIENMDDYRAAFEANKNRPYLMQKLASEEGRDLRVYVMGNKIISAFLRRSTTDFRSNFCLGGTANEYELRAEEIAIVNKVIENLSPDFVGVDILFDSGKAVLNEIENVVGARMLYEYTEIDVADIFLDYIKLSARST